MLSDDRSLDTLPRFLIRNAAEIGARPAMRHKDLGIWRTWTWAQMFDEIRVFSIGLAGIGVKRGDKFTIIGNNRPRLYWAMCAGQALGAIPVPVYADAVADEMAFVLAHAEVTLAVVEDQEQVDKVIAISDRLPHLGRVVYDEARGLRDYDHERLISFEDVQRLGREKLATDPECMRRWEAGIAEGKGSDLSVILYTSGTTGRSKGVMLTHRNTIVSARNANAFDHLDQREEVIAYLPLAWVGDYIFSYVQAYVAGYCVNCPEAPDTVVQDRREIGTTYAFAPPRVYENLLTLTMVRMADAGALKRRVFDFFIAFAGRWGEKILDGGKVPPGVRLLYAIGDFLVYGPLENQFGLSRIRIGYTAGEAIGPEIFRFYRSIGMNLKQLYGQTEASVYITAQPDGENSRRHRRQGLPGRRAEDFRQRGGAVSLTRRIRRLLQGPRKNGRSAHARRLGTQRRRRFLRSQKRPAQNHRPRQRCGPSQGRHRICAEIHREQAQILSQHPRGGGARRRARFRLRHDQYRSDRGRQLGRAQQRGLRLVSGTGRPSAGLRDDRAACR